MELEELEEIAIRDNAEMEYFISLNKKAREKFYINLYQQKLLLLCQDGKGNPLVQGLYNEVQELRKSVKSKDTSQTYSYWVCCNPSPDVNIRDFLSTCGKSVNKVWIQHYCYVIEQRGTSDDDIGKGFHYHALLIPQEGKKHSHIVRELSNTFKHTTDTSNYHFFQVKAITKEEHIRKLGYIVGYKNDEEKIKKQRLDTLFRVQQGIPKCYNSEDFDFHGQYENII